MPPIETFERHEDAVYWPKSGTDPYGEVIRGDPVELKVKWTIWYETKGQETVIRNARGDLVAVAALVVVDRVLKKGSIMWKGLLHNWVGTGSVSGTEDELMEILSYNESSDIKGRNTRRTVQLGFYRNTPTTS